MLYLVQNPYPGHVQASIFTDPATGKQMVEYSHGLTVDEYIADRKLQGVTVATAEEVDRMEAAYTAQQVTAPSPISEEKYWDLLEVLPPCRWSHAGGVEFFHVSERVRGNLVTWCAHVGDLYLSWVDLATRTNQEIIAAIMAAKKEVA